MRIRIATFIKFLFLLSSLTGISGCKKETEIINLYLPKVEIISAKPTALTSFEVIYEVDPGNKDKLDSAKIIFDDITVPEAKDITKTLKLVSAEKERDTVIVNLNRMNHDFKVKLKLVAGQNDYYSNDVIVRSSKCTFNVYLPLVPNFEMYSDLKNGISSVRNNTDTMLSVFIDFSTLFSEKSIEVLLNDRILVKNDISFKNYTLSPTYFSSGGTAFLPNNLAPGIYDVTVIIDSVKFKADTKFKILEGKWTVMNNSFPGGNLREFANFVKDDNLFLITADPLWQPNIPKVWKCDLKTGSWTLKSNFPVPDNQYRMAYGFNLKYNDDGYLLLRNPYRNDTTELWKYNYSADSWSIVTSYPGMGKDLICFFIDDNLYAGCGRRRIDEDVFSYRDFWKLNMKSGLWTRIKDAPVEFSYFNSNVCTGDARGYLYYAYTKYLYEYNPLSDEWTQISKFPGPLRSNTSLVYLNSKIFLVAGEYINIYTQNLKDFWEYSLNDKSWKLKAFIPSYSNRGVSFSYKNQIVTGLGYATRGNTEIYEPDLYIFNQ